MELTPVLFKGWHGFSFHHGKLTVGLTPAVGGRIMSLLYAGHELLYTQSSCYGETFLSSGDVKKDKITLGFKTFGGDKTWVAPQQAWSLDLPPVDLNAAAYQLINNSQSLTMISPICRETGLQISRQIGVSGDGLWLKETITNKSTQPVHCGVWNVSQVVRPCYFIIPAHEGAIRSYHHNDKTLPPVDDLINSKGEVRISCYQPKLFKYGGFPSKGELVTVFPSTIGDIAWQRSFEMSPDKPYAHGSVVEVFNSVQEDYAEAEVHGPEALLKPEESTTLKQQWLFECR